MASDNNNKLDPPSGGGEAVGGEREFTSISEFLASHPTGGQEGPDTLDAKGELEPTAGGEQTKKPRKPRKPTSGLTVQGGRREMKAYTVTEDQLERLGTLQLSTTLCFSFASGLLTFWIGVKQDIAFAGTASGPAKDWWEGLATGALIFAIFLAVLGAWQFYKGRTTIGKIKRETKHD